MSEDVKPRQFWISEFNGNKNLQAFNDKPEEIKAILTFNYEIEMPAYNYFHVIELEPTLQFMKEMGELLKKSELILSYQNLTTLPIHVREHDGSISMQRPKSQIGLLYDETKEVLEKYRKFFQGLK